VLLDDPHKHRASWKRRKSSRPGEILDAARVVFAEKGFMGTRMADIATIAGVTKGTIYLYFPNKEFLFEAVKQQDTPDVSDCAAPSQSKLKSNATEA
jgi:DNA-binding transcriptional regulator YbjK